MQANNASTTASGLVGHDLNKIRFVFRSKTFSKKNSGKQKRSNFQDNTDVTKQSFSSIPSMKVRGHFGNFFVKLLSLFALLTAEKGKEIPNKFPFTCFFLTFHCYKMTEEMFSKFWSI